MYGIHTDEQGQRKAAQPVPYKNPNVLFSRPGWDKNDAHRQSNPRLAGVILQCFYTRADTYVADCALNLIYQIQVILNYKTLKDSNIEAVPNYNYRRVNISVNMKSEVNSEEVAKNT